MQKNKFHLNFYNQGNSNSRLPWFILFIFLLGVAVGLYFYTHPEFSISLSSIPFISMLKGKQESVLLPDSIPIQQEILKVNSLEYNDWIEPTTTEYTKYFDLVAQPSSNKENQETKLCWILKEGVNSKDIDLQPQKLLDEKGNPVLDLSLIHI